jgi:aminoglycoside-2''-adenylyltransferase
VSDDPLAGGGVELVNPVWNPWRPRELADRLRGVAVPWYVAGGWALDLYRGVESREHEDLEIGVPAAGFAAIRSALGEFEFDVVLDGRRWPLDSAAFALSHQTWVRDAGTGAYLLDVFREKHDGETWICRRDETIRIRYDEIILRTADGIPYLAPELVLLFKAKWARPKDDDDLSGVLPLLGHDRRSGLRDLVGRVHPGHRWLQQI